MGGFNPRRAELQTGCRDLSARIGKLDEAKDKEKLKAVSELLKKAMKELESGPAKS